MVGRYHKYEVLIQWLDTIEDKLDYKKWYCGHYHIDKYIDKLRFMFKDIIKLNVK